MPFKTVEKLYLFMSRAGNYTQSMIGRPSLEANVKQEVYDFWKAHLEISVDRRNTRHQAYIKPENFSHKYPNIVNETVKKTIWNGRETLVAQRYIYAERVRKLVSTVVSHTTLQ